MGPCTFDWCKRDCWGIRYWTHILGDSSEVLQYNRFGMNTMGNLRLDDTLRLAHKVMDCMGWLGQLVSQLLTRNIMWFLAQIIDVFNLLLGWHLKNGSPSKRSGHLQIGLWLTTVHIADIPQVPMQGSRHFWLKQAWFRGHSLLWTHSGRHVGGLPINPGTHEQTPCPFISRHWLFGPHGDGWQGLRWTGSCSCWHWTNALPCIPGGQLHIGMWALTSHSAFGAHVPGQGSLHLLLMQALSRLQSELRTHSGRQPVYGSPWNSGRQLHLPLLHCELDPHGEGSQGSSCWGAKMWSYLVYFVIIKKMVFVSYEEQLELEDTVRKNHQRIPRNKSKTECD